MDMKIQNMFGEGKISSSRFQIKIVDWSTQKHVKKGMKENVEQLLHFDPLFK